MLGAVATHTKQGILSATITLFLPPTWPVYCPKATYMVGLSEVSGFRHSFNYCTLVGRGMLEHPKHPKHPHKICPWCQPLGYEIMKYVVSFAINCFVKTHSTCTVRTSLEHVDCICSCMYIHIVVSISKWTHQIKRSYSCSFASLSSSLLRQCHR